MKTVINLKTDWEVKKTAKEMAKELGLSLSAIVNAYLRQFIRTRQVYFTLVPTMTEEFEKLLGPIEADIRSGRNLSSEISSPAELKEYLSSL